MSNFETLKGSWKELKGLAKQKWSKLTDDDLEGLEGNMDRLKGKVQKLYGYSKEEIEKQFHSFGKDTADKANEFVDKANDKVASATDRVKDRGSDRDLDS